ncbi:hypothetical protein [Acidaminococcus fermentans]|uniref:hypothetical protein n=1 Tax=Acidaminococcus fermentans TaxID=905 RepID=UPI00242AB36D|nr:hypothetical protein [Acidaminococcus fermentans]MDD7195339.1 hypothetical protein [Acidaminococcus fermentans]
MDRMEWIIAKAGAEKKPFMAFPGKNGAQSARRVSQDKTQWEALEQRFQFSGPYKLVLLAVKSWRKYRWRTYEKALNGQCTAKIWGIHYSTDDKHVLRSRITPAAVVILKAMDI